MEAWEAKAAEGGCSQAIRALRGLKIGRPGSNRMRESVSGAEQHAVPARTGNAALARFAKVVRKFPCPLRFSDDVPCCFCFWLGRSRDCLVAAGSDRVRGLVRVRAPAGPPVSLLSPLSSSRLFGLCHCTAMEAPPAYVKSEQLFAQEDFPGHYSLDLQLRLTGGSLVVRECIHSLAFLRLS